jgi:predicted metalloprotease with PDZ domain
LARAEELAARRGQAEKTPEVSEPPAPAPGRRRLAQVLAEWWRSARPRRRPRTGRRNRRRPLRIAALIAAVALVVAGGAYAVSSTLSGSGGQQAAAAGSQPWLGVQVANSSAIGVIVVRVTPGSPAAPAGLKTGDVITQLDTEPIVAPAILTAAINGMQPGDPVTIQFQRGATTYTVHLTLAGRPAGKG